MTVAYARAVAARWAITEDYLRTILAIAAREAGNPQAFTGNNSRPALQVKDGVATIPIRGPIIPYASMYADVSGLTSYAQLTKDFQAALDDAAVKAIVLDVDSPGGAVVGTNEFAEMVYAARSKKTIVSYIRGMGASAAYWVASAASAVYMEPTAIAGSIGVFGVFDASEDPNTITIISSQTPMKALPITDPAEQAEIQAEVDGLADIFISAVAKYRGVSAETVVRDFGQGGCFLGALAVKAGLADGLSTYDAVRASAAAPRVRKSRLAPTASARRSQEGRMFNAQEWKDFFGGLLGAAKEHKPEAGEEIAGELVAMEGLPAQGIQIAPLTPAPTAQPIPAQAQAQAPAGIPEQLRSAWATAGEQWANGLVAANRATPAEAASLVEMYTQLAEDDFSAPRAAGRQSRLDAFQATYDQRQPHQLGREVVVTNEGGVLGAGETQQASGPISATRRQELLALSDLGRQALAKQRQR